MTEPGHNNPPIYDAEAHAALEARAREFCDAAGEWLDLDAITDEAQAGKASDFVEGARKLAKEVETRRKAEKEPHLEAGRQVDAAFQAITASLKKAVDGVRAKVSEFLAAEQRRKDAEARAAREKAEREAREAAEAQRAAEQRNDVMGAAEAEAKAAEAQKAAERVAPAKARVTSASGGGRGLSLRTSYRAEIDNINVAFRTYRDHPELRALLVKLAEAEVRSQKGEKTAPAGFRLHEEKSAA